MENFKNYSLKTILSIAIFVIGYQYLVKPIDEANAQLEVKYLRVTLSNSPIEIESQIQGKFKTEKHYEIKTKEYHEFNFIVSNYNHCSPSIINIPPESHIEIGISIDDHQKIVNRNSKNEDKFWKIISVYELTHLKNESEMVMYLNKEIEEERRMGFRKYLYPFSILIYLSILVIIFEKGNKN